MEGEGPFDHLIANTGRSVSLACLRSVLCAYRMSRHSHRRRTHRHKHRHKPPPFNVIIHSPTRGRCRTDTSKSLRSSVAVRDDEREPNGPADECSAVRVCRRPMTGWLQSINTGAHPQRATRRTTSLKTNVPRRCRWVRRGSPRACPRTGCSDPTPACRATPRAVGDRPDAAPPPHPASPVPSRPRADLRRTARGAPQRLLTVGHVAQAGCWASAWTNPPPPPKKKKIG